MTEIFKRPKPLMLMILDGWGHREGGAYNAIADAHTPVLDSLFKEYPSALMGTSGLDVGLPPGQMGNSEIGHQNIGAGRVVYQDLVRISRSIESGEFFENPAFNQAMDAVCRKGSALHLMGLLSDGGVHSHIHHLRALLDLAKNKGVPKVWVHAFLDGRDTPPTSGIEYIQELEDVQKRIGVGKIATVMGRFYAMDRDNRWERIALAYRAMVHGEASYPNAETAVKSAYNKGETDEFVKPLSISYNGTAPITVRSGDAVIFYNFRADRAREITRAFTQENFSFFPREKLDLSDYICMTEYDKTFSLSVAFTPVGLKNIFPEVISHAGLKQLRISETEKYAHVTFFFNGGEERVFSGEERILIPSPRDVETYDKKPEMSAPLVTDEVIRQIERNFFDVMILNFANGDMVGHTGVYEAAVKGVEAVDRCIGRIYQTLQKKKNGALLITSDHGNCEMMKNPDTGEPFTAHTTNPVPLILTKKGVRLRGKGILADVAPTLLNLLSLSQPAEMTGKSLIL
ncbi:MAG: 2,3-bisphosphoglycerate-independent phosphoglycerate mutase [Nitrospirae bacterium CG08_land_8_20_14_0_20_52_24]|nr:MAG: 2,3-bisphosphoglycerate-independent phosphoglycerate mutase [Nitrospirae bacterium CG08_land_8_20_14_0_20_52_24]PIV85331.1 MAG: 2,3-bisphosphoglycerate-independent phosphoglycerate mutase [Nitrospirae bacterium CG17_big_fil_post_rev_8_21_14_2_50_50_9]